MNELEDLRNLEKILFKAYNEKDRDKFQSTAFKYSSKVSDFEYFTTLMQTYNKKHENDNKKPYNKVSYM